VSDLIWVSLLIGLASYRIWRLIAIDTITAPLRRPIKPGSWVDQLVSCAWCLGFWITIAITFALDQFLPIPVPFLIAAVASVFTAAVDQLLTRLEGP
jgi:hypothetical protein